MNTGGKLVSHHRHCHSPLLPKGAGDRLSRGRGKDLTPGARGWDARSWHEQGSRHFEMVPLTSGTTGAAHAQRGAAPYHTQSCSCSTHVAVAPNPGHQGEEFLSRWCL